MTILHICLFQMKPWITQQPSHTLGRRKYLFIKKITMKQSPLISEFHLLFTLRIFSICHKTILPQQMHGAVDIIITHLNIIQAFSMHAAPNVYSWIFTHDKREALFTKKTLYAHILYIWKCISMPCPPTPHPPFSQASLSFPCTLSCGRQHWARSHATSICELVKRFPCFPLCYSLRGPQWKQQLMIPDTAGHVSW